jgi:hypothetical protein
MPTQKRTAILLAFLRALAEIKFRDANRWDDIQLGHPIAQYFPGGAEGFADVINDDGFFRRDGIVCHPNNFRNKKVIGDLYDELIEIYIAGGWRLFA